MVTKKTLYGLMITLLAIIIIAHTIIQFAFYGTGIQGFYKSGISGFSIGKTEIGETFKQKYATISSLSKAVLILEWLFILVLIAITTMRRRTDFQAELETIKLKDKYEKKENTTDLDILYKILKDKKRLNLSTIAKMFKINKEVAKGWCETLESGGLATLYYPRIGDLEVVIN